MKPEIKKLWIEALRSGEYEQGKNYLCKDGKFCCLGVLCDLAVKNGVMVEAQTSNIVGTYYDGCYMELPGSVSNWAGLEDDDPHVGGNRLSSWNDRGSPFNKIADLIEDEL